MDWFRFYSEAVRDPKIRRISRLVGKDPATVLGVWTILLSMASESRERGRLLLGDIPVSLPDIDDMAGFETSLVIEAMLDLGMLAKDADCYIIPAWGKRQFTSDSSTERVRKLRERSSNSGSNGDETLQQRSCNGPEAETEAETEAEAEVRPAAAAANAISVDHEYAKWVREYQYKAGLTIPSPFQADMVKEWMGQITYENWQYVMEEAAKQRQGGNWKYIEKIVNRVASQGTGERKKEKKASGIRLAEIVQ
jgi:hypothetical protein